MALPVTLRELIPNLREVTEDMSKEEMTSSYNENIKILLESFKVDGDIDPEMDNVKNWGLNIAKEI